MTSRPLNMTLLVPTNKLMTFNGSHKHSFILFQSTVIRNLLLEANKTSHDKMLAIMILLDPCNKFQGTPHAEKRDNFYRKNASFFYK